MGKLAISIPAAHTAPADAMRPGLLMMLGRFEEAYTAYTGLNVANKAEVSEGANGGATPNPAPSIKGKTGKGKTGTTGGNRPPMSEARKKQLSIAAKKRWAEKQAAGGTPAANKSHKKAPGKGKTMGATG